MIFEDSKVLPPAARKALPYLLLIAAVFAAYYNVYSNVFLFDDNLVIQLNDYLKSWNTFGRLLTSSTTDGAHIAGGFYRPLQMMLYFFIYQVTGAEPPFFHFLNIALHAADACLVFLLGRKLRFNSGGVFLATLIWAVHPLHTEAITYISGTADPLFTFFCLLGVVLLLPDFSPRKIFFSVPIFILGLLSKEGAVVFPALALITLYFASKERLKPKTYLRTWPLWLVAGIYIIWRMSAPGFDGPQSYGKFYDQHDFSNLKLYATHFDYRLYTFLATLPDYLKLFVWPTGLHMERNFPVFVGPWSALVAAGTGLCMAAMAQILWGQGKRGLPLSWGLLWFAVAYFPNTGLIFPMNAQFLEHWMYLPSIGLFLGVAETVTVLLQKHAPKVKPVLASLAVLAALILGILTFEQNTLWQDAFSFYGNIFKYGEPSPRAHNNLALAYMDKKDYPAAIAEFHKAIESTDTYAETRYNLALALLQLPDQEAQIPAVIESLNRSLEIDPNFYRSWDALAIIYYHIGDKAKAEEYRKKAEALKARLK